jgi:hypothetical protein
MADSFQEVPNAGVPLLDFAYLEALEKFKLDCLNSEQFKKYNDPNKGSFQNTAKHDTAAIITRQDHDLHVHSNISRLPNGLAAPKDFFVDVLTIGPQLDAGFENVYAMIIRPRFLDDLSSSLRNVLYGHNKNDFMKFRELFNKGRTMKSPSDEASESRTLSNSNADVDAEVDMEIDAEADTDTDTEAGYEADSEAGKTDAERFADIIQEFGKSLGSRPDLLVSYAKEFISSFVSAKMPKNIGALMLYRMPIHKTLIETLNSMNLVLLHLSQCSKNFYKTIVIPQKDDCYPLPNSKKLCVMLDILHFWSIVIHEQTEEVTITFLDVPGLPRLIFGADARHCGLLRHM